MTPGPGYCRGRGRLEMKSKTSLKITQEYDGEFTMNLRLSDEDIDKPKKDVVDRLIGKLQDYSIWIGRRFSK